MKLRSITILLFVLVVSSFAFAAQPGLLPNGEAWVKAFKAGDIEAIVALYAPDAVSFPPDAMMAKGTDEIRKSYAFLNDFTVQSFEMVEANHEIHGNIAFAWGRFKASLQPKAGGAPMMMEGRFTDISKKVGGKWLYIVDHASAPMMPPSQTQTVPATK